MLKEYNEIVDILGLFRHSQNIIPRPTVWTLLKAC